VFGGLITNSTYTVLKTWLSGEHVGTDQYGNRYYRRKRGRSWRDEKRWVVFARDAEPTEIPPGWVGWLHRRLEHAPSEQELPPPKFERERATVATGTGLAYRPPGSVLRGGRRSPATGDYEAWRPE
jgi:NADH:ubiquinone oxidoreductase subunit